MMNNTNKIRLVLDNITVKQLKYKTMYEVLEHWKEYQLEKQKEKELQEFDKFLSELIKKNGVTKY